MDTNDQKKRCEKTTFPLGNIYITPGAQAQLSHEDTLTALARHSRGDWGEVGTEDRNENELSVKGRFRHSCG
jgi:hypothetical protein